MWQSMKLYSAFISLSMLSLLLQAEVVQPTPTVSCKGTNAKTYKAGETYKDGCIEYVCDENGILMVKIDETCCPHKGRYYQVGEVIAEIPNGKDCILEHTICTESGQVVTKPVYGKCNCEYNGKMLRDGDNVTLSTGNKASCYSGAMLTPVKQTSTLPDVKLVGGLKPGMGKVYINHIPVGDCNWDTKAATILCRDLGFGYAIEIPNMKSTIENSHLGNFSIKCIGNEASMTNCKITDKCNSGGVASVRCSRVKVGENGQVFLDGEPLCVDGLKETEGRALCRELGFSTGMLKASQLQITSSKTISCSRDMLSECITTECSKTSPMASLTCSNKRDVQLYGGNGESEGNVYYKGGPVCDDDFDINDANVVCRELGFDGAEKSLIKSSFGLVKLPFTLDNVHCKGNESTLSECQALGDLNCGKNEGAGVICAVKTHSSRQLSLLAAAAAEAAEAAGASSIVGDVIKSGAGMVGDIVDALPGIINYFDEQEKEHQLYLKERPDMADLSNEKISIKMKPLEGYLNPTGEFKTGGYEVEMGKEGTPKKESRSGGDAFTYSYGIGPMLMNGCYGSNYAQGDPCYAAKRNSTKCLDQIEAANYVGVGFDGTGDYSHGSRKKSLIQRTCAAKSTYHGEDVPDMMNVFGIYDTSCSGRTFDTLDARSAFQRQQSDMGSNEDLLTYKGGTNTKIGVDVNLFGGIPNLFGGPSYTSSGIKNTNTKKTRRSNNTAEANDETTKKMIFEFTCTIRRYNIFLDEVTPEMLSVAFLEDYMSLPVQYYDFGKQAPRKYSNFLQRWGTHYIKSASFGGKFTLLRESKMHDKETKTEWEERVQEDTSSLFESKDNSVGFKLKPELPLFGLAGVSANIDTNKDQTTNTTANSSRNEGQQNVKNKQATSYSMDDIIVEGGDQKVASILADKHRSGFKAEFIDWLESIPTYPKGYDFQFGELTELLDMNLASLLDHPLDPCWKKAHDRNDTNGHSVCGNGRKCFYNVNMKNDEGEEIIEERKCQFESSNDFKDQLDQRRLSLKRATDIFIKSGGKSTTEVTLPGGESRCEDQDATYKRILYDELLTGEVHRVNFDLREDIGEEIQKAEILYISFLQDDFFDDNDVGEKIGRWVVDDSALNTAAGQYSKQIKANETSKKIMINGVQFTFDSGKSGNFLKMTAEDYKYNGLMSYKECIESMKHQECVSMKDLYWIDVPLATVHSLKTPKTLYPCHLEWSNANMLMSDSSCVRFTATSEGPIYFALAAIPNRPDTAYYLRISPTDVTIYKNATLMDEKTNEISAVGLGHKDIFQSYIVCSEHIEDTLTRITYGKLAAHETMNKDATLNAYLTMEDEDIPIKPVYFAIGSGEAKVQIVDMERVDLPKMQNIKCRGDTINVNGHCVLSCRKSKIAEKSQKNVDVKCYSEDSNKKYNDSDSQVPEGSYCEASCPDKEIAFPSRTVCTGHDTWTEKLNCHKQCDMNDTSITEGLLVINGKEEFKKLEGSKISCSLLGVNCDITCGKDQSGLMYKAIGVAECSTDSTWMVNSKKVKTVCRSSPCSTYKKVANGTFQCDKEALESGYVSEGTQCKLDSCSMRFKKKEPSIVTCSDGEWRNGKDIETLECIPTYKTCPADIPSIDHGSIHCNDTDKSNDGKYFGATICNVKCENKYRLEDANHSSIQCINGVWVNKAICVDSYLPEKGYWNLIFRQTIIDKNELYKQNEWYRNKENVEAPNFSILRDFEKFRRPDGSFHLFLWYPELQKGNEWIQYSNPVEKTSQGVDFYEPISTPYTGKEWGGLEHSNTKSCLLDGSVNSDSWFFAIGTTVMFDGGMPGPEKEVKTVELYLDFEVPWTTVQVSGGTPKNENFLSAAEDSGFVDMYSHDDSSGRQEWILQPIQSKSNQFYIMVQGGTATGFSYLSTNDAGLVDMNSQHQQEWTLQNVTGKPDTYNIIVQGEKNKGQFLSASGKNGDVGLALGDYSSGRQQWILTLPNILPVQACTRLEPCGSHGDCGGDSLNCKPDFFCGTQKKCEYKGYIEILGCSSSHPCPLASGDCDRDSDCLTDLKCGKNKCQHRSHHGPNNWFDKGYYSNDNCCIKP